MTIKDFSSIQFLVPLMILSLASSLLFFNQAFGQVEPDYSNNNCGDLGPASESENSLISTVSAEDLSRSGPSISISTDLRKYIVGDGVAINGHASDSNGCAFNQPVYLEVLRDKDKIYTSTILPYVADYYESTSMSLGGGYFLDSGVNADKPGVYTVNALVNGPDGTRYIAATSQFEVKEIFDTRPAYMLYVGLAFFGGLAFILSKEIKNAALTETLRFICLSGIAFSIIAALLLTDVQIGTYSPVGLVVSEADNEGGCRESVSTESTESIKEWMINFGGQPPYYCGSGIQVPVNIIVFGIAGGYLRYLWDTARLRQKIHDEMKNESQHKVSRTWLFYVSLHDLALFILSPLLAVVVWFVLSESGATGLFTIAAVSFTVGLVTEEIIQTLIRFTTSVLRAAESVGEKTQDKIGEIKEISNGNGNVKDEAIENKVQQVIIQNKDRQETKLTDTATAAT
jgi:hypothetical protein